MKDLLKKIVVSVLTIEAGAVLKKYRPKVAAITGSVGKTSTKDAVHLILASAFPVRKSAKSFNSEIGLPLTVLGRDNGRRNVWSWLKIFWEGLMLIFLPNRYPQWLVLEVGADRPGDIERVSHWLKSDVAVFSQMAEVPVHVEFFESPEAVLEEKINLLNSLKPGGLVIFNFDDPGWRQSLAGLKFSKFSFGFDKGADLQAGYYKIFYLSKDKTRRPGGVSFKVNFQGNSLAVKMRGVLGRPAVYAALAALSVGLSQNLNLPELARKLENFESPPGRMRLLPGAGGSLIIDDSYNSSPIALTEALRTLKELDGGTGRKLAILGDMLELGRFSIEEHRKAGRLAAAAADFIFTVGVRTEVLAESAAAAGFPAERLFQFNEAAAAGQRARSLIKAGDLILVKGSQGMRMERAVEQVMAEPEQKSRLLARQEAEWINRN